MCTFQGRGRESSRVHAVAKWPHGCVQGRHGHPPPQNRMPPIDQQVLDSMDPADRAAALAAQYGDMPPHSQTVQPPGAGALDPYSQYQGTPAAAPALPPGAEDMPKFDVHGGLDNLRSDLAVAVENVGVLRDLMSNDVQPDLLNDVVRRCQAMRSAVHKVIDHVSDEEVLDYAVQVWQICGANLFLTVLHALALLGCIPVRYMGQRHSCVPPFALSCRASFDCAPLHDPHDLQRMLNMTRAARLDCVGARLLSCASLMSRRAQHE
jgi:hypothetical protein